ncbi:hypothetical protein GQ43DRAFT_476744 [Delitschia confertaspora ATCC 74209]|uniref:Uncharacterized protein n=1 Tax=Delitschia confertaspora ATCC 74209 TaxID=1513339 RepID=A0A9P4JEU1_9PLEO|nr:hypothetical protein GQ43DRAFT_476744 [Delitschia confertaspora ATCC 74209]
MDRQVSQFADNSSLRSMKEKLEPLRREFQSAVLEYKKEREELFRCFAQLFQELDNSATEINTCIYRMQDVSRKCSTIEDRMTDLFYSITILEDQSHNDLSSWRPTPAPDTLARDMAEDMADPSPPIVEELYNRFGDYKCYLEQLHNFESTFHEELHDRDSQRANGGTGLSSDEEFFEQQRKLRTQLMKDLDQAKADVASLRQQCIKEDITFKEASFLAVPDDCDSVQPDDSVSQYTGSDSRDNLGPNPPSLGFGYVESWEGYYDFNDASSVSGMIPWGA